MKFKKCTKCGHPKIKKFYNSGGLQQETWLSSDGYCSIHIQFHSKEYKIMEFL